MIVRVVIKNLFSFKDQTEFHTIPGQATRLKDHKYKVQSKELLKLSAIYGANGSGKSNFIRAVSLLRQFVKIGNIPIKLSDSKFKLSEEMAKQPSELGIEFVFDGNFYYYSIAFDQRKVIEEYLCTINLKRNEDELLFHRTLNSNKTEIKFFKGFEDNAENSLLKGIIEKDLLKPEKSLLFLINSLSSGSFGVIQDVFTWFDEQLIIIYPHTKANSLPLLLDNDSALKEFASDMMCSFGTGISNFVIAKTSITDYFGENEKDQIEKVTREITSRPDTAVEIINKATGEEVVALEEDGEIITKRIYFEHTSESSKPVPFNFNEESDGTKRLIEYLPALFDLVHIDKTYLIDEIERSVHPVIIKELISKFSNDSKSKGQLIFTTHESNLLDQDIFRTDEIWFAQKNKSGASKLYSLSEFKEHNTIDIRKGYLNGRYGAIPFIGNLQDLNWHKYAE